MEFSEIAAQLTDAVEGIRKALYGVDVREDIAKGMELVLEIGRNANSAADDAASSAKKAAASESDASLYSTAAQTNMENARSSAAAAQTSETNAANSETAASTSEKNAKASADAAKASADRAAAVVSTDKTLSTDGAPADAKAVGDRLTEVQGKIIITNVDPGVGSDLKTGAIVLVYNGPDENPVT